ncbi:MAG: ABC transporter permease [Clostridia bacterium]|nr:ABC transporter permease [Clostridia bacterium]
MRLALHPVALLIAALIALITVLISAAIPARRAARLQPIDAIRQSTDVKAKPREVRTSKLTEKLFGFEGTMGAKNFKRNRKGYRAAVLSLFMSIVLFIGASSFCMYLTDMVSTLAENANYDVFAYVPAYAVKDVMAEMRTFDGVTRSAYFYPAYNNIDGYYAETALLTDAFLSVPSHTLSNRNEQDYVPVEVLYLEDDAFRALCKASGVDPEPYFDPENPNGVLMNTDITESVYLARNKVKRYRYDLFRDDALPASVTTKVIQRREGFVWEYHTDPETMETRIAYYPEAYWKQVMENYAGQHMYTLDETRADAILSLEEATETVTYSFDAFVKTDDFCLPQNDASLIYPFSKLDASTFDTENQAYMFFAAKNHKAVREALLELIENSDYKYNAYVGDAAEERENSRMIVGVVNTFAYGFIILISLIAAANVFNTISTAIMLRRREFAMLKSIGMTDRGMRRMLSYECVIYGLRALLFGLPVSVGVTYLIHRIVGQELERSFYMPWHSVAIAVGSVFLVVFATMLYARHKLSKDNPIDALKNENL